MNYTVKHMWCLMATIYRFLFHFPGKTKLSILQAISPTCMEYTKEQSDSSTKHITTCETGKHQISNSPRLAASLPHFLLWCHSDSTWELSTKTERASEVNLQFWLEGKLVLKLKEMWKCQVCFYSSRSFLCPYPEKSPWWKYQTIVTKTLGRETFQEDWANPYSFLPHCSLYITLLLLGPEY